MNYEPMARKRVTEVDELSQHEDTIFYDWSNWDEHMEWIATAPIEKIISWANEIESYSRQQAAAALGSLGGKSRSDAKRKASANNGKKGGRPRTKTE